MADEEIIQSRPVGALVHALRILRHLSAMGRAEGVSAIARATGVNPSTCFNILRTLTAEGLVSFDAHDKTYQPAMGLVELAVGVLGTNPGDLIRPELERLAIEYKVLICLWHITAEDRIVLIERAFDPAVTRVDLPLGKRLPVYTGGVGRILAAHRKLTEAELRAQFVDLRWQCAPESADEYIDSVRDAAASGYGVDLGQLYIGVDVVGALVVDAQGVPRYGISSISLSGQMDSDRRRAVGEDLVETCARIGAQMFALTKGKFANVKKKT
ncbi:IclR family transcriptional regulator [Pararhodobacter marinus]|uniref:IclR family transcriptional regulator n=1 Tax=Pararhodobacter marinus TaxID=2184063 RepID=UPI00143CD437|nr:IclR family transcriptional regulator [Pararhodobacter marinus]